MICDDLIEKLSSTQHLAILTGAGVSAESGIPTFRDALTGLWQQYDATQLACAAGFWADPALVWGWYEWRRQTVLHSTPNQAHRTIAKLAQCIPKLTLITQNVDDLHERAGSTDVIHLHGSLHKPRCISCGTAYRFPYSDPKNAGGEAIPEQRISPPRCLHCGDPVRPGVVWFGEALPAEAFEKAQVACMQADLLMVIGTSGMVYPAANLPYLAKQAGVSIVEVNPVINGYNASTEFRLQGFAGELLPALYQAAFNDVVD